jgi:hypothetical protein
MLMKYATCNICTKVCPVQKYGLADVLEHFEASGGGVLGKGTEELAGYTPPDRGHFGPGELPHFTTDEARIRYDLLDQLPLGVEPWVHQVGAALSASPSRRSVLALRGHPEEATDHHSSTASTPTWSEGNTLRPPASSI